MEVFGLIVVVMILFFFAQNNTERCRKRQVEEVLKDIAESKNLFEDDPLGEELELDFLNEVRNSINGIDGYNIVKSKVEKRRRTDPTVIENTLNTYMKFDGSIIDLQSTAITYYKPEINKYYIHDWWKENEKEVESMTQDLVQKFGSPEFIEWYKNKTASKIS